MSEKRGFDVVVVGGGVIGLACAWRLAQRGAEVAVLERGEPRRRRDAGRGRDAGAGRRADLRRAGAAGADPGGGARCTRSSSPSWRRRPGESTGYERLGALHVALDRDEAAQLRRVHDLQRSLDLEAEWLSTRQCRELEPGLAPSFHGGVFAAGEAAIDPRALTQVLLAALRAEGVEVRTGTEVVDGIFDGEHLVGVRTAKATTPWCRIEL